jgi:hypothetical protein
MFCNAWKQRVDLKCRGQEGPEVEATMISPQSFYQTNPFSIGNLFPSPWFNASSLSISLLDYYVAIGWPIEDYGQKLVRESVSRGDIEGMIYLKTKGHSSLRDPDFCVVAGAAGQLEVLRWLREDEQCPWNPAEVYREATENACNHVMDYVIANSKGVDVNSCYGDGLPFS